MSYPLVEIRNLSKIFKTGFFTKRLVKAVDDVSFTMPKGGATITALVGESGSGKTTLGRLLLRLERPTSGDILYKGKNIKGMSKKELFTYTKEVQPIFQDPYGAFNPFYKVDHVLRMPVMKFRIGSSEIDRHKLIVETLEAVGLSEEILDKYPHQLSGGERQRIIVSRAFLVNPELIIADEPVSMIDTSLRAGILNLILDLKQKFGKSFLFITHDLFTAYYLSNNILVLYRGSIVEKGDVEAVINKPCHPYLKTLISSVPVPDPKKRWKENLEIRTEEITYITETVGCKFYGRCPEATETCLRSTPQLLNIGPNHDVACHLYTNES